MSYPDLSADETREIIRRHAHDLRNMINCMDLDIVCLLEDTSATATESFLHKLRDRLALTERTVHSLSVRFREPSVHIAAAVDLFYNWRQQMKKLSEADHLVWEEPDCNAAINVDFTAVITVLVDLCLQLKAPREAPPATAALHASGSSAAFILREPVENAFPTDAQQWKEWERLIAISGGKLERSVEASPPSRITSLVFPTA